jgi:predicted NAD/FAD-binding protein
MAIKKKTKLSKRPSQRSKAGAQQKASARPEASEQPLPSEQPQASERPKANEHATANDWPPPASDRSVAVIGGGIAGITAAVKLFQQGYHVTLFESADGLGGNFSSNSTDDKWSSTDPEENRRDIYPHIMGDWYREFWHLLEKDFGLERWRLFAKRDKIKMAILSDTPPTSFADVEFDSLSTPTSLKNILDDIRSGGAAGLRDMFLFGYTYLDLVSTPRREQKLPVLEELDVTGYLYSRPFMNENVAEMHDAILKVIWSMPSEDTSAKAYQDLVRHTLTFPKETPFAWLLKGSINDMIMRPIQNVLFNAFRRSRHSHLRLGTTVKTIDVKDHVVSITTDRDPHCVEPFRFAIVATPCKAALKLAFSGTPGTRLVDTAKDLAQLREGHTGRIPVVYLYFKPQFVQRQGGTLAHLPKELIGFRNPTADEIRRNAGGAATDVDFDISILDISKLWETQYLDKFDGHEPVLVLAASRADLIPEPGPEEHPDDNGESQGFAMIQKLAKYLPFICPGDGWGVGGDIDWERTRVITNYEHQLFLNDAGSASWRPHARVDGLCDVFFAGDYCLTDVNMATIEAAAQSGVLAAQEVQKEVMHGHPIYRQAHDLYANSVLLLVKLASMPLASAIAFTELWDDALRSPMSFMAFPYTVMTRGAAFGSDWIKTAIQLYESFFIRDELSPTGAPSYQSVSEQDRRIGLAQWVKYLVHDVRKEGPELRKAALDVASDVIDALWERFTGNTPPPRPPARSSGSWPFETRSKPAPPALGNPDEKIWTLLRYMLPRDGSLESLSDTATGLSATARGLFDNLDKARAPPGGGLPNYSAAIKAAVRAGAGAIRDKDMGYRDHETVRGLRDDESEDPSGPGPGS